MDSRGELVVTENNKHIISSSSVTSVDHFPASDSNSYSSPCSSPDASSSSAQPVLQHHHHIMYGSAPDASSIVHPVAGMQINGHSNGHEDEDEDPDDDNMDNNSMSSMHQHDNSQNGGPGSAGNQSQHSGHPPRRRKSNGPQVRPTCLECGKDFSNQSALSKHKLTHSDVRRFSCSLCGKAFKRQDHLNGHMLTHRDKKPYECDVDGCEKTYCDARSLRRHKENHHQNSITTTSVSRFTCPSSLPYHQQHAHVPVPVLQSQQHSPQEQQQPSQQQQQQQQQPHSLSLMPPAADPAAGAATDRLPSPCSVYSQPQSSPYDLHMTPHHAGSAGGGAPQTPGHESSGMDHYSSRSTVSHQYTPVSPYDLRHPPNQQLQQQQQYQHVVVTQSQFHGQQKMPCLQEVDESSNGHNVVVAPVTSSSSNSTSHQLSIPTHIITSCNSVPVDRDQFTPQDVEELLRDIESNKSTSVANGSTSNYLTREESDDHHHSHQHQRHQQQHQESKRAQPHVVSMTRNQQMTRFPYPSLPYHSQPAAPHLMHDPASDPASGPLASPCSVYSQPQSSPYDLHMTPHPQTPHTPSHETVSGMDRRSHSLPATPIDPAASFNYNNNQRTPVNQYPPVSPYDLRHPPTHMHHHQSHHQHQHQQYQHAVQHQFTADGPVAVSGTHHMSIPAHIISVSNNIPVDRDQLTPQDVEDLLRDIENENSSVVANSSSSSNNNANNSSYLSENSEDQQHRQQQHSQQQQHQHNHEAGNINASKRPPLGSSSSMSSLAINHHVIHSSSTNPLVIQSAAAAATSVSATSNTSQQQQQLATRMLQQQEHLHHRQHLMLPQQQQQHHLHPATSTSQLQQLLSQPMPSQQQQPPPPPQPMHHHRHLPASAPVCVVSSGSNSSSSSLNNVANSNSSSQQQHHHQQRTFSVVVSSKTIANCTPAAAISSNHHLVPVAAPKLVNTITSVGKVAAAHAAMKSDVVVVADSVTPPTACLVPGSQNQAKPMTTPPTLSCSLKSPAITAKATTATVASAAVGISSAAPASISCSTSNHHAQSNGVKVITVYSPKRQKHKPEPIYIPPHVNACGADLQQQQQQQQTQQQQLPQLQNHHPHHHQQQQHQQYQNPKPLLLQHQQQQQQQQQSHHPLHYQPMSAGVTGTPNYQSIHRLPPPTRSPRLWDGTGGKSPFSPLSWDSIEPRVNVGPQYQARIPECEVRCNELSYEKVLHSKLIIPEDERDEEKADLVFDPMILDQGLLTEDEVEQFLAVACSSCVPGVGRNIEYAYHLIHESKGDLTAAMMRLLEADPKISPSDALFGYHYPESDLWSTAEINAYHQALIKCDKDFNAVAHEVQSKSVKQCIQFYYLWKKVCPDEYRRLRITRRKREQEGIYFNSNNNNCNAVSNKNTDKKPSKPQRALE